MAKRKVSLMKDIKEEMVQQVRMLMFSITFPLILIVDFFLIKSELSFISVDTDCC